MSEEKRSKTNIALITINIIFQSLTPLAAAFLIAYGILAPYWIDFFNVFLVIGWIVYFIFIIIVNVEYFPTEVIKIIPLFLYPIGFGFLASLRHGAWGLGNFVIDTGTNIFISIALSAIFITFFGAGIKAWNYRQMCRRDRPNLPSLTVGEMLKEDKRFFQSNPQVMWQIFAMMVPTFLLATYLGGATVYQIFQTDKTSFLQFADIGIWLVSLGGTIFAYYRQIIKLSVFN